MAPAFKPGGPVSATLLLVDEPEVMTLKVMTLIVQVAGPIALWLPRTVRFSSWCTSRR